MQKNHLILGVTLVAIVAAVAWRSQRTPAATQGPSMVPDASAAADAGPAAFDAVHAPVARPRLIELGSDECVSCRAMIPVLDELREENGDVLIVDFIDVWKYPDQAEPFDVRVIPTQVFQAPDGTELARHEGFFAADAVRERWSELGYPLTGAVDEQ